MKDIINQRLTILRSEYSAGLEKMKELEEKKIQLSETLLRISGAIQELEEVLKIEK